jgi:NTE family protein
MKLRIFSLLLIFMTVLAPLHSIQEPDAVYPKVALVLSGGSALGFAHIGVLKVIEEVGIPVDMVIGTSMGGLVGALYATGYTPNEIDRIADQTDWDRLFTSPDSPYTFNIGPVIEQEENLISISFDGGGLGRSLGLLPDQKVITFMSELTAKTSHIRDFDQFHKPYRTVAVDLVSRKEVLFSSGRLIDAMRSTMAVPGMFAPYEVDGRYYVDGGILNNLPIDVAQDMGADIIIAVDVDWGPIEHIRDVKTPLDLILQLVEIVVDSNEDTHKDEADILIVPDLGDLSSMDFNRYRELIDKGEESAVLMMPELIAIRDRIAEFREIEVLDKDRTGHYESLPDREIKNVVTSDGVDFFFPLYMFSDFKGRKTTENFHIQIERVINQIVATGKYESISYTLLDNGDRTYDLELKPVTLERGKHSFGVGFGYSGALQFSGPEPSYYSTPQLTSSLIFTELFETNSYAAFNLRFGEDTDFKAELFVPFDGLVYLKPQLRLQSGVFSPEGARQKSTLFAFSQEVGFLLGENTEIGAAAQANQHWIVPDVGSTQSSFELLYGPSITWKTTEKQRFLHEGSISTATLMLPAIGGESWYSRFLCDHQQYFPLSYNSTLSYSIRAGSYRGQLTSVYSGFDIGGWDGIPGYMPKSVINNDIFLAGLSFSHRFGEVSKILGFDVYALSSIKIGKSWENVFEDCSFSPDFGGSAGLGMSTTFGDIIVGAGVNNKGEFAYYLMIN